MPDHCIACSRPMGSSHCALENQPCHRKCGGKFVRPPSTYSGSITMTFGNDTNTSIYALLPKIQAKGIQWTIGR